MQGTQLYTDPEPTRHSKFAPGLSNSFHTTALSHSVFPSSSLTVYVLVSVPAQAIKALVCDLTLHVSKAQKTSSDGLKQQSPQSHINHPQRTSAAKI